MLRNQQNCCHERYPALACHSTSGNALFWRKYGAEYLVGKHRHLVFVLQGWTLSTGVVTLHLLYVSQWSNYITSDCSTLLPPRNLWTPLPYSGVPCLPRSLQNSWTNLSTGWCFSVEVLVRCVLVHCCTDWAYQTLQCRTNEHVTPWPSWLTFERQRKTLRIDGSDEESVVISPQERWKHGWRSYVAELEVSSPDRKNPKNREKRQPITAYIRSSSLLSTIDNRAAEGSEEW